MPSSGSALSPWSRIRQSREMTTTSTLPSSFLYDLDLGSHLCRDYYEAVRSSDNNTMILIAQCEDITNAKPGIIRRLSDGGQFGAHLLKGRICLQAALSANFHIWKHLSCRRRSGFLPQQCSNLSVNLRLVSFRFHEGFLGVGELLFNLLRNNIKLLAAKKMMSVFRMGLAVLPIAVRNIIDGNQKYF